MNRLSAARLCQIADYSRAYLERARANHFWSHPCLARSEGSRYETPRSEVFVALEVAEDTCQEFGNLFLGRRIQRLLITEVHAWSRGRPRREQLSESLSCPGLLGGRDVRKQALESLGGCLGHADRTLLGNLLTHGRLLDNLRLLNLDQIFVALEVAQDAFEDARDLGLCGRVKIASTTVRAIAEGARIVELWKGRRLQSYGRRSTEEQVQAKRPRHRDGIFVNE